MSGLGPALPELPARVSIRDVGPRDGLQPEEPIPVADRIALVHALVDAGLTRVEVAAFVSPKAVPAMAGAADVVAGIERRPGVTYAALVPNLRGAEMALEAGVDELTVTISASPTYNRRNVRMEVEESVAVIASVVAAAGAVPVDAVVSCGFGSPYEADLTPADAVALGRRLADGGATHVTYADTTGMATPLRVAELHGALGGAVDGVGLHLHDTRGTALVNAYAALGLGFTRFDTAVGGLGGSPFAHGAGGNLATEELVALLDDLGVATGIDVEALAGVALRVEALVGRPVPSGVAHAGPRTRAAG
ncbi:hydroxymethylglutaryl-CoA lyase [Iamia sp. SCSIO 61187]|nr:hydroxymethylglutaryl-CoA lyase [Iamia sp. SCSIO 61187]QYG92981.1 hydroxymethylglutaryl-CoA lyase [Iamia sp. SCSIO 61187]